MAEPSTYWIFESGIGEDRALLIETGRPREIRIERDGTPRIGDVSEVRLARILGRGRGLGVDGDGREYLVDRLPPEISEGRTVTVETRRLSATEGTRVKWQLARLSDKAVGRGPTLEQRIDASAIPIKRSGAPGVDILAGHGWHDLMDAARTGLWQFAGGSLIVEHTQAMTVIDIDGDLPPRALAFAAAPEVAHVIRLFGLSGSIGVDFPTLEAKSDRVKLAEIFDETMDVDCERTALNGFGFMQIVMRRERPSVGELIAAAPAETALLEALRSAERAAGAGRLTILCHPAVAAIAAERSILIEELSRRVGRQAVVQAGVATHLQDFDIVSEEPPT